MQTETTPRWGSKAIDPHGYNLPSLKARYLLEHLPTTGKVLEVGSGDGKFLRTLAVERPGVSPYGCDIRPWASPDPNIEFRQMENDIPYADATFDAVLVADVLEHVPQPAHTVAEIARVLKPDGRFVGFVPIEGEPISAYSLYKRLLGDDLYERTKHHVQAYTHAGLVGLLEEHFELADVSHAYHAIGHLLDATFFAAAHLPRLQKFWWQENRYYTDDTGAKPAGGALARVLNSMLTLGNAVAYAESRLLAKHRLAAAGMLFEARRRPAT